MRVFTAMLMHETSSFSPIATTLASYGDYLLYQPGVDPPNAVADTMDSQADFVREATRRGHEVIRGPMADTAPGQPAPRDVFEALRDRIVAQARSALPIDLVLLTLHGAQSADGCEDCEGDLLERLRHVVGPSAVIAVELDLHFNLTRRMVANATLINSCMEYPHTDIADRATRLFALAESTARCEIRPVMEWAPVPMLGQFFTTRQPMRGLVDRVLALEREPGVLSISLGHGFPHADTTRTAASVLVVTDGDRGLAARLAHELAAEFFALREEIKVPLTPLEDLEASLSSTRSPVVVADGSDNPGGGAPCDSTFVTRALLAAGMRSSVIAWICDPDSVQRAIAAGVGAVVRLEIGGRHGPAVSGTPIEAAARVCRIEKEFRQVGLGCGPDTELGATAVVDVEGIEIVLVSRRNQHYGPDSLAALGIDVRRRQVVVVKSSQHFHTRYAAVAGQILYVDAPGALTQRFRSLPYRNLERPIWPIDDPPFFAHGRHWPSSARRA